MIKPLLRAAPMLALLLSLTVVAQQPAFTAATVRPTEIGVHATPLRIDPVHLRITGATLRSLILRAFDLDDFQLEGGPPWVTTQRFSIEAVTDSPASRQQMLAMLANLLTDRFQLKTSTKDRAETVYALKLGPKGPKFRALNDGEASVSPVPHDGPDEMTISLYQSMPDVVAYLNRLDGPGKLRYRVVDRTGLTGRYNLWITLGNETFADRAGGRLRIEDVPTALRQQLDLLLVPQTAVLHYVTIDSAAPPS